METKRYIFLNYNCEIEKPNGDWSDSYCVMVGIGKGRTPNEAWEQMLKANKFVATDGFNFGECSWYELA